MRSRSGPRSWAVGGLAVALGVLVMGCSPTQQAPPPAAAEPSDSQSEPQNGGLFVDVSDPAGLDFRHQHGGTGRKYLPEIMGAGGCALDFDGDSKIDLFFVQSGSLTESGDVSEHRLYRNLGDGTFGDATDGSGVAHSGYGMGAVCADYDNDGDPDIYVVHLGGDRLLRNEGDGTFSDVTTEAGIVSPLWGSSATFFDADADSDLDLFVANYVEFTLESHVDCGKPSQGVLSYCHPDVYPAAPDVFFRNRGDGTFEEATAAAGLVESTGKGLGVVALDFDNDGLSDLYVANDSTPNFLFHNRGNGTFEEIALYRGVGHNEDGKTEAGMGTDAGDVNGDGWLDVFVTNLNNEPNALYLGGQVMFTYSSRLSGLVQPSFRQVGFGTELADLDNDGDLDLVVSNGHVIDNIELTDDAQSFRQPGQVFLNDGGANFVLLEASRSGDLSAPRVGRGTIKVDFDDDGRLDLAVIYNDDRARLYRNQGTSENWIGLELEGTASNRDGIGARVTIEAGDRRWIAERRAGSSYQTSGDPRLHFGLGSATRVDRLTVRWPSGTVQTAIDLETGRYHSIRESAEQSP